MVSRYTCFLVKFQPRVQAVITGAETFPGLSRYVLKLAAWVACLIAGSGSGGFCWEIRCNEYDQEQPQPQGRVDLPLPAEEPALPHQGAIRLSESELAHSQPYQDPLSSATEDLVPRALQRRQRGSRLGIGESSLSVVQLGSFVWQSFQDSWLWADSGLAHWTD